MEKTYTIIVPIYNVQAYISECIESVIAQTYPKWELIIVDDESEDDSLCIARQYAEKDSRIRILVKQHGGLPQTRNYGLREASGDYIVLLDGDDYLAVDHLEKCNKILDNKCDMCIFNNHVNFTKDKEHKMELFPVFDGVNSLSKKAKLDIIFSPENKLPASAVLTIYRRNFLINNNIRYNEEYRCSEDLDFFLNNIIYAKNICFADHTFYFYRQDNMGAMTKNISGAMLLDRLTIYEKWFQRYKNEINDEINSKVIVKKIRSDMCINVALYHQLEKDDVDRNQLRTYIDNTRHIWENGRMQESYFYIMHILAIKQKIRNIYLKLKRR